MKINNCILCKGKGVIECECIEFFNKLDNCPVCNGEGEHYCPICSSSNLPD